MSPITTRRRRYPVNESAIILNGFARGGTNIVINLILSHPRVCYPGETHKALAGGTKSHSSAAARIQSVRFGIAAKRLGIACLADPYAIDSNSVFPREAGAWIRSTLKRAKINARHENHNRWKAPEKEDTRSERRSSRLLLKNNNLIGTYSELFDQAFPNARTVCLFRHPFGLMESQLRTGRDPDKMLRVFREVWTSLINRCESDRDRHMLVRFEDVLADPLPTLKKLYTFLDLDLSEVPFIRLQHKPHFGKSGKYRHSGEFNRQVTWYPREEIHKHLDASAPFNAIERLATVHKDEISATLGETAARLGYSMSPPYLTPYDSIA